MQVEQMRACRGRGESSRSNRIQKAYEDRQSRRRRSPQGPQAAVEFSKAKWGIDECVHAGNWMLGCTEKLDYFVIDDRGFLAIAPTWQTYIDKMKEELLWRHPLFAPHLTPPPLWTGWRIKYDDRLQAKFVRGDNPEARPAIRGGICRRR